MDLPEYQLFLNAERLDQFWALLKWLLFFVAPVVMLFFATDTISLLITALKKGLGFQVADPEDEDDDIYYY